MTATTIPRFNTIIRIIGFILVIPSILGFAYALLLFVGILGVTQQGGSSHDVGSAIGQACGGILACGSAAAIVTGSLVGGLVGWLLLLKRKVYRCSNCGFIIERA
jgi:hypothetical protein